MSKLLKKANSLPTSKLDPYLRMCGNGNFTVNQIRSELKGNLAVPEVTYAATPVCRKKGVVPARLDKVTAPFRKGRLEAEVQPEKIMTNVFIELASEQTQPDGQYAEILSNAQMFRKKGKLVIAQVPLTAVPTLVGDETVLSIERSQTLTPPRPAVRLGGNATPAARFTIPDSEFDGGANVLVGIIDVGGFDFAHPDFLDAKGNSRFVAIWDQGGNARPAPEGFGFGAEFLQEHLDAAIRNAPRIQVPPQYIERQSQMHEGSHGTHVASIAAGNSGICPKAAIAGVLIALDEENDLDRRKSFFDSSSIALAVDYLLQLGKKLGKPVSINISLGTNGHAHDGSAAVNRWMDAEFIQPGRCVCVAAGNAGQEAPLDANDTGFILGRIHTSGQIEASGLDRDIEWIVVGNNLADVSENELEIWYSPQDRFSVSIKPPGMDWIGPVRPREFIENQQLRDGSFLSIYNELFYPTNGSNLIGIYLSPNMKNEEAVVGIPAGVWKVRLHGDEIRDGHYHGWIERDDPRPLGRVGEKEAWNFPSFFSAESNIDRNSVNSLACGHTVIGVGNYDPGTEQINKSSSQGPTRDGRLKPEIIAPGTNIVAANGFSMAGDLWIEMTGTSMASPFVCGVAGLMLSAEPSLTSAQIAGIMMRTSRPVPGATYRWKDDLGYGLIHPAECLREARAAFERKDITTKKLQG